MSALVWEDIVRMSALVISICCTIYNLISSVRQNTCSAHINKLIKWYVESYHKGNISKQTFIDGMEHLKELLKLTYKDSNTEEPQNREE